jgi:hypothetical protein
VYGCAGIIHQLQEEILAAQCELARTRAQLDLAAAQMLQQQPQQQQTSVPLAPPSPRSPQGAGDHHHVAAAQNQEEASFLDPDEFLDLGRF